MLKSLQENIMNLTKKNTNNKKKKQNLSIAAEALKD